ncbi:MAG: HAMP domain-containing histidine kinase [Proteobacteria bacterium]|nr:HAMP domain-containing histidine kinase [Pseudomonadota bacterium]
MTPPEPTNAPQPPPTEDPRRAFLRLVSHELRTPLNSILGFSEILSAELYRPLGSPQYKEYAEIIRGSGKKLLKLVNQVLEIGRLEGVKLDVGPEAVEPALEAAVAACAHDFARGVRPRIVEGPDLPLVLADPWGLRTVLGHLVQNAAAFAPDGGEVRLRAEALKGHVDVFVEDDGEGVDPADLPRLMQPFEQGENALVRRVEGAGLGLAICELTCGAMGAQLKLTSRPGQGLTARVRLRRAAA